MVYDPYETCPYDKSHSILRSRMAFHLTRCAKNHPNSKKKTCPYDVRHIIDPADYQHHVNTCPARESVIHYALHDPEASNNLIPIERPQDPGAAHVRLAEENWDNDVPVKSYNPMANIEERNIIRPLIGASKAVKKQFRENERRRIQQLENQQERLEKQKAEAQRAQRLKDMNKKIAADSAAEKDKECKPLRRPKNLPNKSMSLNNSIMNETASANTSVVENSGQVNNKTPVSNDVDQPISVDVTSFLSNVNQPEGVEVISFLSSEASGPRSTDATSLASSSSMSSNINWESTGAIPKNSSMQQKLPSRSSRQSYTSNGAVSNNNGAIPKTVPFSYANALGKKTNAPENAPTNASAPLSKTNNGKQANEFKNLNSINESFKKNQSIDDYDVVIESEQTDTDKENMSNCSFVTAHDNSIIDKVCQDMHEISLQDEGFQKVTYKLNKKVQSLKNKSTGNDSILQNGKKVAGKRQTRVAANFSNFK